MDLRVQVFAIVASGLLLVIVLELVRRRRLMERYALLWLLAGSVLVVLAAVGGVLDTLAGAVGIVEGPNVLFLIAFGFTILVLLHFSTVISSLTDQSKILAQRLARQDERVRQLERGAEAGAPPGLEPAARTGDATTTSAGAEPEPVGSAGRR